MRKMLFLVVTGLAAFAAQAQNNNGTDVVRITGTRLTYPLVEKWIKELAKPTQASPLPLPVACHKTVPT